MHGVDGVAEDCCAPEDTGVAGNPGARQLGQLPPECHRQGVCPKKRFGLAIDQVFKQGKQRSLNL